MEIQVKVENFDLENQLNSIWKMGTQVPHPPLQQPTLNPQLQLLNLQQQPVIKCALIQLSPIKQELEHQVLQAASEVSLPSSRNDKDDRFIKQLLARNRNSFSTNSVNKQYLFKVVTPEIRLKSGKVHHKKGQEKETETSRFYQQHNKQNRNHVQVKHQTVKQYCQVQDCEEVIG